MDSYTNMRTNFESNHRFHGLRRLFVSFICAICAIVRLSAHDEVCGFTHHSTDFRPVSSQVLADDLSQNSAWEINATDTSLARTALKIAKESYPEIDSEYYLEKIENIKTSLRDETEPEHILKTMNIVLFNEL